MDVDRILCDLTVEQLAQAQASLEKEAAIKKEELRQMVGRRYRDVIEASNTIRRLAEIATELSVELGRAKESSSISHVHATTERGNASIDGLLSRRFILLNSLFQQENLHRSLLGSSARLGEAGPGVLRRISEHLIVTRLELSDRLAGELGWLDHWQPVVTRLAALALLNQKPYAELLDLFLQARMDAISVNLSSPSSSLIDIIRSVRQSVQLANEIFGGGEAFLSALHTLSAPEWCPDTLRNLIDDQPCGYGKIFESELRKINVMISRYGSENLGEVEVKCAEWTVLVCSSIKDRVDEMCSYFSRSDQLVEFVSVINHIFKTEWPKSNIISANAVHRQLFGDVLDKRLHTLVTSELQSLRSEVVDRLPRVATKPVHLFQRKSAKKFDALAAAGVSHDMNSLVQQMCGRLKELMDNVYKYANMHIGADKADSLSPAKESLVAAVLSMLSSLLEHFGIPELQQGGDETENQLPQLGLPAKTPAQSPHKTMPEWLATFRFFLALIQHEPSVVCQCMGGDAARIVVCNNLLKWATEYSLCHCIDIILEECRVIELESPISSHRTAGSGSEMWLDCVQAMETIEIEAAGSIGVPTHISPPCFNFLYHFSRELNSTHLLGHLLSPSVNSYVSQKIGAIFASTLVKWAQSSSGLTTGPIHSQMLFDSKVVNLMFPNEGLVECANKLAASISPIELRLVSEPIDRNSALLARRLQALFHQLQTPNLLASREMGAALPSSYSAAADLTPKLGDIRRLALIPRLRSKEEVVSNALMATKNKQLASREPGLSTSSRAPANSSFSNLYDKISTGWFKS